MEKLNPRAKNVLKWSLKIVLSALAIYLVSRKIDFKEVFLLFPGLKIVPLSLAIFFFNVSKILSAVRYRVFVSLAGASISATANLKLYYVGMFYNLFLPGGIGGDGYKIYLLNKDKQTNWKELTWATLIERISGLAALAGIALVIFPYSALYRFPVSRELVAFLGLAAPFIGLYIVLIMVRKRYTQKYLLTSVQSFSVQFSQVICAYFILTSLAIEQPYNGYILLFLVSSIVAVIPFTIGGVGARELVFVYAGEWLNIEIESAVAFSLIFFLITAFSSLIGVLFDYKPNKETVSVND